MLTKNINRKGFSAIIIIGMIAVILVVGVAGYFVWKNSLKPQPQVPENPSQQSSSTTATPETATSTTLSAATTTSSSPSIAGWKMYVNAQYGFSFQYPSTWIDAGNSITDDSNVAGGDTFADPSSADIFDVRSLASFDAGESPQQIANETIQDNYCSGNHIISTDNTGTLFALGYYYDIQGQLHCSATLGQYAYVFNDENSTPIQLSYHYSNPDNLPESQEVAILEQIVSTLKINAPAPPALINDQYDLFIQSTSSAEIGYVPAIQYYNLGTVSSGKYAGYYRLMASVPDPDGEDYYSIIFATQNYKAFIVDNSSSTDFDNYVVDYNPAKVVGFDDIPLDAPPATISLGNFVLQQNDISFDDIQTSSLLTSSVPGLTFYSDPESNPYADYGPDFSIATSDPHLAYGDDILVKTQTGPIYDYSLFTKEEFSRSSNSDDSIDYGDSTSFYQGSEISSTDPHYNAYGQVFPGQCGGEYTTYVLKDISQSDLAQIGTTTGGIILYAPSNPNSQLNKDQYNIKMQYNGDFNQESGDITSFPTYQEYISKNPVLIFQDLWGRYIALGELDYPTVGGCGKPVIYLYPPKPTEVSVKFATPIRLTTDIPTYAADGWDVMADPDGELTDLQPQFTDCTAIDSTIPGSEYATSACENNDYPYLYWEGQASRPYPTPTGGWIVAQANISSFLNQKLTQIGLTEKEESDMMAYWVPQLLAKNTPYYRVSFFQTAQMDQFIPMDVTPTPDTVIRVFLDWSALTSVPAIPLAPENLIHIDRKGFTLVEWGGLKQ